MGQAHQVYFDTLVYAKKLKEAGVAWKEAEAQTEVLAEVFGDHIATKQDITEVKHDMSTMKSELSAEINALRNETKADISALRSETKAEISALKKDMDLKFSAVYVEFSKIDTRFSEFKSEINKWTLSVVLSVSTVQMALLVAAMKFLH